METPELKQLMESYYHENYYDEAREYGHLYGPLHTYLEDSETGELEVLKHEIALLRDGFEDDKELGQYLHGIGSYVFLGDSDLTYREWLLELEHRIDVHLSLLEG